MKKQLLTLSLLFTSLFAQQSFAQCSIIQTGGSTVTTGPGFLWGQSFTAPCAGLLDSLDLVADAPGTISAGTLNMYNGSSVTGSIYSQPFSPITVNPGDPIRIRLTTPLPVANGMQYTFEFFVDNVNVKATFSDVYAGGMPFQNGQAVSTADFDFHVFISLNSSVNTTNELQNISLYPNPTQGVFNINLGTTTNAIVNLFSVDGKLVMSKMVNEKTATIDISNLAKGFYNVQIIADNKTAVIKLNHN